MRRRTAVRAAVPLCFGLAGCSGLRSGAHPLSVTVFNHSDRPYAIELTFSRTSETDRSDARAFSGRIDVEPNGEAVREDVADPARYLIEYACFENDSRLTDRDHVHYYPGDEDEGGGLAFDLDASGTLTRRW
ncbi:hypothetical protein [Halorubrum sp. HHNYT27]|uniref:hypothetical protein n=1 Tax=Halorubrum sp. HHNYT27 TaxID=3402275 RepID=UPI003EBD5E15